MKGKRIMRVHARKLVGSAVSAMVLFLGLSAFTVNEEAPAARGEELFRDHCAKCHGLDARGMCMAPSLIGVTKRMSTDAIAAHARSIADEMMCARSIKELSDKDFTDITDYLKTVSNPEEKSESETSEPQEELGDAVSKSGMRRTNPGMMNMMHKQMMNRMKQRSPDSDKNETRSQETKA